jgi:hypothetical protein
VSSREGSDRGGRQRERASAGPSWAPRQRSDSGAGVRPRSPSAWTRGDSSDRGRRSSDRGYSNRGYSNRGYSNRGSSNRGWNRQPFHSGPRSHWPNRSFRHAPRYPSYYRHGYYHRHGYYFPRYYYDYGSYATHASVRVLVEPEETEVYVDGYYAGIVDDFDGVFQRLNLAPGSHEITLRLDGYRSWSAQIYVEPGSTVSLRHDMVQGAIGSEIEQYSSEDEYDGPDESEP